MTYNLAYDYSSIVLLVVLVFYYYATPKYKNFQNALFGLILVFNLVSCVMDVISAGFLLERMPDAIFLNRLVLSIYQFCQHSLSPMYFVYIIYIVYPDNGFEMLKKRWPILIPGFVVEFINISSVVTQWGFKYDVNGYGRTPFYFVSLAVMAFYMVLCLVYVFRHKSETGFLPKLVVVLYTFSAIVACILQFMYPYDLVICLAATVSIFSMYLALQNPILLKEALEDAENSRRAAEEANLAKSNFLANMSHEIRTPMNAICGMTYLLESTELRTDAKEYVDTIQNASESLLSLINEILDFSKVDAGKMNPKVSEYKTETLVRDVDALLRSVIEDKEIVTSIYVAPDVPKSMLGDVHMIKQILINLLNNAIKYTESGEVSLDLSVERKENNKVNLIIKVKDTGIGIKEEDLEKIFATFEQVDMAKNRRHEGTGLGLALVKAFCELMNGKVSVESSYGNGSTFTAVVEQEAVSEYPSDYFDKLKQFIYVVLENNPYTRRSIEKTLKSLGVTYTFSNSFEKHIFDKFKGVNYCLIYNDSQFKEAVSAVDTSDMPGLYKISRIGLNDAIPEDYKDVHYLRNPINVFSLCDSMTKAVVAEAKKEEQEVFFSNKVKVAIVDDNKVNLKVTSAILKRFGITAKTLISGYEMLDEFEVGENYDLIFMDHMMPDMDGVETVKRIRALHKGNSSSVPIVALTANAVTGVEKEYYDAGMNAVLFKPVNAEDLKKVLVKWLPASCRVEALPKE